jgi:GTP cyclohydrolase IA
MQELMDMKEKTTSGIPEMIKEILTQIGEDPNREGLLRTPERVSRSLKFLTSGYGKSVDEVINGATFSVEYDEMVVVKDIDIYSTCEHHLIPFYGKCHVAYVPNGKIVGLSKIPRIVDLFARRLQVQERLTTQIANCLIEVLKPQGVGVVIEAIHLCMVMRGVEKQNSIAMTSAMKGAFMEDERTRKEFLNLISKPKF